MKRKSKAPVASTTSPCIDCGPGKVRASYFPSDLRAWEQREGGEPRATVDALEALAKVSTSETWLMIEDLIEFERDGFLSAALSAISTEAAAAYTFRAQGVEVILRKLRTLRASGTGA